MHYHLSLSRTAARAMSFVRSPYALIWILSLFLLLPQAALGATCADRVVPDVKTTPSTTPMASGTSIVIDVSACDPLGIGINPLDTETAGNVGHVTADTLNAKLTYTNHGGGATTDSFDFPDADNVFHHVTVNIGPNTSPISITPASLTTPHVGIAYTQTLTASGGVGLYTFTSTGSLPGGLTLSSTGVISGTPNQAGSYSFTVTAHDSGSLSGPQSYVVSVPNPSLTIPGAPNASVNSPYSFTLSTTDGTGPITYTLESGALPTGLSLTGGVITGTPTVVGTSNFTIRATDGSPGPGGPYFKLNNLSIQVTNTPPTANAVTATVAYNSNTNPIGLNITGPAATSVAVAQAASHGTATASGTSITYTPTTGYAGPDTFTYTASNGAGTSSPATVTITVSPPTITYTPTSPASSAAGAPYNKSIAGGATGGAAPYTYAPTISMPAGLTMASNGVITGTPTAVGTFVIPVRATDSSTGTGPFSSAPANVTIAISVPNIVITPPGVSDGTVNTLFNQTFTASGGNGSYSYSETGHLPAGITLSSAGVLSGTTTEAGSFPITVTARDATTGPGAPYSGSQTFTLNIAAPTITLSPASLINATVGTNYSQSLTASGGTPSYSFNITLGLPPSGLTLAPDGTLSGTPTTAGDFNFTAQATDAQSFTGTHNYSIHVTAIAPGAPTGAAATPGPEQATVSFVAPTNTGGAPITGYTVTSSPGGLTATGANSPIVVNGLTDGTGYTFTVVAENTAGPGPASDPTTSVTPKGTQTITFSNPGSQNFGTSPTLTASSTSNLSVTFSSSTGLICSITPGGALTFLKEGSCSINADQAGNGTYLAATTVTQIFQVNAVVPGAPLIGTATAGNAQATVNFTAPASAGGASITGYTATSNPGGITATAGSSATSMTVTGLTNGTPYTFTVTANNSAGTGITSGASNSVTPQGTQTITFANPGTKNFGTTPTLPATATSGLAVTFTSTTTNICTITSTGVLTPKAPGSCSINADQVGDAAWVAAPTVTQAFAIAVPGGAVSFSVGTTLPAATGEMPYNFTITATGGAAPYTFSMVSGSLPSGMNFSPAGLVSGTPLSGAPVTFTVHVVDQATQTADQTFQLTVNGPAITVTPATLTGGTVGHAYSQALSASGGVAPYTYAVTSGTLPAGITLSPTGAVSGTPTGPGNFNFSVTATDSHNFQAVQLYSVAVGQPAPIVVNSTAQVNANGSTSIPTTGDTGPITSLTITQQPAHGTATVNGLNILYTPAHDYFGSDSLKYTATGPGGTSGVATVTITVVPGAVPVATAQSATVLGGKSVTIHAAAGATGGPFTTAALVNPPTSGTAVVQGTDIVYTADPNASGTFGFDFTLSNAFGASQPAHATITVNARPVAPNLTASVIAGTTVQVDLTTSAHGGPFTDAKVVSISPANAGAATVQSSNGGYKLSFTAAPTFGGVAQVSYTLSNAFATSDPGSIAITVTARSDPSKNAEVLGVLDAQADSARRMALGQINNFQRRLEALHNGGGGGFSNGVTFSSASSMPVNGRPTNGMPGNGVFTSDTAFEHRVNGPYAGDDQGGSLFGSPARVGSDSGAGNTAAGKGTDAGNGNPGGLSVWTGGAVNFGKMQPGSSDDGIDFTTSGLSMGADKQVTEKLALGAGVGYGHDVSDIGQHTSRSTVDSYNVAFYGSYRPAESVYVDALVGYQWLSFDARRYVTDNGNTVHGSRDGKQWFASFSTGYQHSTEGMMLTPYGRLDIARANLEGYTETGDAIYSLKYQGQDVNTSTATVGVLAQWTAKRDYGTWAPQLRAEFGHDLQGSSQATMRYADLLNGPSYQATLQSQSRNHTMLGAGVALQTLHGWMLRFEYQNYLDNTSRDNQSILLGIEKKFDP